MKPITPHLIAACALFTWSTASFSHIVLKNKAAAAGSTYKAVFQVGHGCGSLPTTSIAVQIPPGFQAAKPHAKASWLISQDGNKSITWTAASKEAALPSLHFDEFVMRGKLPDAAGPLWFAVLQNCDDGVNKSSNDWAEIPAAGVSTKGLKSSAALLEVISPAEPVAAMPAEHKH